MKTGRFMFVKVSGLLIFVFFLASCATVEEKKVVSSKKNNEITRDVVVFSDIQKFDFDNDGVEEMVAVYKGENNNIGVKIIEIAGDSQGEVIFEQLLDIPNGKFEVKNGKPAIVVKRYACGGCVMADDVYYWNGTAFVR